MDLLTWAVRRRLRLPPGQLRRHDILALFTFPEYQAYYQPDTVVAGLQTCLREMGLAQLVYLVGFSLTFLLEGFTGLSITVGAILTLFLMNVRTTFISLTAIPLSLAVTVIVFKTVGGLTGVELSINVMTLGGIAVAMGSGELDVAYVGHPVEGGLGGCVRHPPTPPAGRSRGRRPGRGIHRLQARRRCLHQTCLDHDLDESRHLR